jgi:cytoplasmic iron level regulating protein YaaA (DUF328/UPF0246 family)
VLAEQPGLVLDLRSESYVALGPAPESSWYVRVICVNGQGDGSGRRSALTHFNKKGKGQFTRAVLEAGIDHQDLESLLEWAARAGIRLSIGVPGELDLVV